MDQVVTEQRFSHSALSTPANSTADSILRSIMADAGVVMANLQFSENIRYKPWNYVPDDTVGKFLNARWNANFLSEFSK